MLEQGHIRNAAEKAWAATKRATDALILERTGREPRIGLPADIRRHTSPDCRESEAMLSLRDRYGARAHYLHAAGKGWGDCFYDGHCEPEDVFAEMVRDTADYIREVETLASDGD